MEEREIDIPPVSYLLRKAGICRKGGDSPGDFKAMELIVLQASDWNGEFFPRWEGLPQRHGSTYDRPPCWSESHLCINAKSFKVSLVCERSCSTIPHKNLF
jgi:hypothetical protein